MAAKNEEFDVLTFFIYVMSLLTVIVGGFAAWNYKKVDRASSEITREVGFLTAMQEKATDEAFRHWLARERQGQQQGGGDPTAFMALVNNRINQHGLGSSLKSFNQQSAREVAGGTELTFRLVFEDHRVEALTRLLVKLEEDWPGARVKQIVKLDWDSRAEGWDSVVDVAIFKSDAES